MKPIVGCRFLGRFGNQCMSYLYARAHAERNGAMLCTDHWVGQRIFQLDDPPVPVGYPRRDENTLRDDEVNCEIRTYAQQQKCMIWTREQARRWFRLRPEVKAKLDALPFISDRMAHVRRGDMMDYGYPVPSVRSYLDAALKFHVSGLYFVSEEDANVRASTGFEGDLAMLPDFYRLMSAKVLFRANSTFSFVAAVLSHARVFSPVIDGLHGGKEHDCEWVEGNWPRLANLEFTTDLRVRES